METTKGTGLIIERDICREYKVTIKDLRTYNKNRNIAEARQLAIFCWRKLFGKKYREIAFRYRSEISYVFQAIGVMEGRLLSDPHLKKLFENYKKITQI